MKYSIRGISHNISIDEVIGVVATCDANQIFDGVEPVTVLDIVNGWADVNNVCTDTKYFCAKVGTRARHRINREARVMKAQKWSNAKRAEYLFGDIDDTLPF